MTTLALTYDAIAARLGITTASARRLVQRKRWPKGKGNDGRAVVQVPAESLERRSDSPKDSPDGERNDSPSDSPTVSELLSRLEEAHQRLGAAEALVPVLRETVDLLKAALATEKDRTAELRDRLSARRSWWPWRRAG